MLMLIFIRLYTVSPLNINLQVANFQRSECVFACPITKLVHMSASSTSDRAVCKYSSTASLFQAQDVQKQAYNSSDVAGTVVNCVNWVPRVTLLDLQNTLRMDLVCMKGTYCIWSSDSI